MKLLFLLHSYQNKTHDMFKYLTMKKTILNLFMLLLICVESNAQCDIKTNNRPDGNTIKYFNPKPIVREKNFELGASIYQNQTTGQYLFNMVVLHKNGIPKDVTGNLKIQTNSNNGIALDIIESKQVKMNGNNVTIAMFEIDKRTYSILKSSPLKSIFFELNGELFGSTITENRSLLINQLECLE